MDTPLHIASVGECTIDDYLDLDRQFIGGISMNFAVNAKRSGAERVSLLTRVGNDHNLEIFQKLSREVIDSSHVSVQTGETARQNILLNENGERVFPAGGYLPGVLNEYILNSQEVGFLQQHNVIVCALFKQVEPLFYQLIQGISFDGWLVADFLDLSDYSFDIRILHLNLDRLKVAFVSGDAELVERLLPLSSVSECAIVVTMGAAGSVALVQGESLHQPAFEVEKIVDTTGCGDAFQAAFIVSYWKNQDVKDALKRGAEQAAKVIQHLGAIP